MGARIGSRLVSGSSGAHHAPMVEYGNGVGQATGVAGGGGGGGGSMDAGAAFGQFVNNAAYTISTMPPAQLALIVVALVVGLIILKRAF